MIKDLLPRFSDDLFDATYRLINSGDLVLQRYGWAAILNFLNDKTLKNKILNKENKGYLYQQAIKANKIYSLRALLKIFKDDRATPNDVMNVLNALTDDASKIVFVRIAIMAIGNEGDIDSQKRIIEAGFLNKRVTEVIQSIFKLKTESLNVPEKQALETELFSDEIDSDILCIFLSKFKSYREKLWPDSNINNLKIFQKLLNPKNKNKNEISAIEDLIQEYSFYQAQELFNEMKSELSMREILRTFTAYSINVKEKTIPDKMVSIEPQPFRLSAQYHPYPNCWKCEWERTYIWTTAISSSATIPISEAKQNIGQNINETGNQDWRCFKGSDYYVGAVYGVIQKAGINDVETPGVQAYGFGIAYKIWMPVQDPNNGATSWLVEQPKFIARFGFKPSPECNFIAIRWKGHIPVASVNIICSSGSLYSGGEVATEALTNWKVYAIVPGADLEFEVSINAVIQFHSTRKLMIGYLNSKTIEDFVEIIEINSNTARFFNYVALINDDDPRILNYPSAAGNGLLCYIAAIQKSIDSPVWPRPVNNDSVAAFAFTLSELSILKTLSKTDFSQILGNDSQQIPWSERQKFLRAALPLICFRLFNKFITYTELEISSQASSLLRITGVKQKIHESVNSLKNLTADMGNLVLASASKLLQEDIKVIEDLKLLAAALFGAQEEIAQLEVFVMTKREFGCNILKLSQYEGVKPVFPPDSRTFLQMKSSLNIEELCFE